MRRDLTTSEGRTPRRKAALFSIPETLGQALYQLVHDSPQSVSVQAELLNLSPQFVYNIGNPNLAQDGVAYPLKHLIPHTQLTKNRVVIDFIEQQLGCVAVPVVQQLDLFRARLGFADNAAVQLARVAKELGELAGEVERSIADTKLVPAEAKRIRKEGWDLIRQTVLLIEELKVVDA